jgi:nitrogen regulatory protein P-II 2
MVLSRTVGSLSQAATDRCPPRSQKEGPMKQLVIIVKPFRAEAVIQAIAELDVMACVVRDAKGYGRQKGYLDQYMGSEYSMAFLPKVEISVWVHDDKAEAVAERMVRTARTGRIGDGKIFVLNTAWPEPLEI